MEEEVVELELVGQELVGQEVVEQCCRRPDIQAVPAEVELADGLQRATAAAVLDLQITEW